MGLVKVSRNPIKLEDKKATIDLDKQRKIIRNHRKQLLIALSVSICINIILIVKLLIN